MSPANSLIVKLWPIAINTMKMDIFEDYCEFGLSGELAARALKSGIPVRNNRVCTEKTIPYNRDLEDHTLPNTKRIVEAAMRLLN